MWVRLFLLFGTPSDSWTPEVEEAGHIQTGTLSKAGRVAHLTQIPSDSGNACSSKDEVRVGRDLFKPEPSA